MSSDLGDELDRYIVADIEDMKDALMWWYERRTTSLVYHLWCTITSPFRVSLPVLTSLPIVLQNLHFLATTVDVERVFSQGWLVLSHVQSRLSVQSTHALLCLGVWSRLRLVKDSDIKAVLGDKVIGEEDELPTDWDTIRGCT
jgi:hypothetical protein